MERMNKLNQPITLLNNYTDYCGKLLHEIMLPKLNAVS